VSWKDVITERVYGVKSTPPEDSDTPKDVIKKRIQERKKAR
jgi:hypothetical protein